MTDIPEGIQLTPFDPEFARNPYAVYARLRTAAPVHYDGYTYVISGYAEVTSLIKDERLSVDPRKVGLTLDPRADNAMTRRPPGMMNLDDPEHGKLRALVNRAFTPTSVSSFRVRLEEIAAALVRDLPKEFDAIALYAAPFPTIAIAEYIGVDSRDHEDFKRWTDTLLLQGYPMPTEKQWTQIIEADASIRQYVRDTVRERQKNRRDDLISRLVDARATEDEVVGMCSLLIGAGNFTTTDLIGNALLRLSESDRDRIPAFVEETLKLDPPSQSVRRWALEDVIVSGTKIPEGSPVLLIIGAANHDPDAGPHLSFGRGVHHCLGAALAKLEAEVALQAFPAFTVRDYKRRKSMLFRGCSEIQVSLGAS